MFLLIKPGTFSPSKSRGIEYQGRALFDALTQVVYRAFRDKKRPHLDMLWYLWCGPLSPLFGKDKISTFENYFVAEKEARVETKNPYFKLIHQKDFCREDPPRLRRQSRARPHRERTCPGQD